MNRPAAPPSIGGDFFVSCADATGRPRWESAFRNGVTYEGANRCLDRMFPPTVASLPLWYVGLINSAGYAGLSVNDTYASHPGWSEWTALAGSVRGVASFSGSSGGCKLIQPPVALTVTATGTIRGCLLASSAALGGTGVLFCTGAALTPLPVVATDIVYISYLIRAR